MLAAQVVGFNKLYTVQWVAMTASGGGLGHLGVQFAKALGLNIVVIDARDESLKLTKKGGTDLVVDARKRPEDVVRQVHAVTNGGGVTCTLNVSDAEDATKTAVAITKMRGTVIQIEQLVHLAESGKMKGKGVIMDPVQVEK
jgi:propanol-preferring alcohol dehydrogenase